MILHNGSITEAEYRLSRYFQVSKIRQRDNLLMITITNSVMLFYFPDTYYQVFTSLDLRKFYFQIQNVCSSRARLVSHATKTFTNRSTNPAGDFYSRWIKLRI